MTFQTIVRIDQTTGIVGEIILSGPTRAQPLILNSTSPVNNVIGRAFNHIANSDTDVAADEPGVFAGILVNPKVYATSGPASGTLDPTLTLPNETQAEFLYMGLIVVDLSQVSPVTPSLEIGANIWAENSTGILVGVEPATPTVADYTQVPNTVIRRNNVTADPGLAIIELTN